MQWPIEGVFRKTGIPLQVVKNVENRGSGVAETWCGQWPIEGVFRKTGIAALHVVKIIFGQSGKVEARSRGDVVWAMAD